MIQKFSSMTIENMKYYVYALVDPSTYDVFYIGKGTGNRIFHHESEERDNEKNLAIAGIVNAGREVEKVIIRHGLSEEQALHVEAAIIDLMRYRQQRLTNIQGGYHSLDHGIQTVDEIESFYAVEEIQKEDFKHNAIVININQSYAKENSIYDATRGNWVVSPNKLSSFSIAIAEYRGVFRAVFAIKNWEETDHLSKRGTPRMRFDGTDVSYEPEYQIYMNKKNGFKKHGQANPIQFVTIDY